MGYRNGMGDTDDITSCYIGNMRKPNEWNDFQDYPNAISEISWLRRECEREELFSAISFPPTPQSIDQVSLLLALFALSFDGSKC